MTSSQMGQANVDSTNRRSVYVSDPSLQPFLEPSFDPTDFLNSALPQLSLPSSQPKSSRASGGALSLNEVYPSTQNLLSNLSAQTSRLSNTLTQLTDEILRSGSRLAYEVEVLRGETLGLSEALTERLKDDVEKFIPGGLHVEPTEEGSGSEQVNKHSPSRRRSSLKVGDNVAEGHQKPSDESPVALVPPDLKQLRTLSLVRDRLDTVIKVFGEALEWTMPPSEVSISSSFISVSAPEPGAESQSQEDKGREFSKNLREEVMNLLSRNADDINGLEAATEKVAKIRELASVWKGTAEEKARLKLVESLVRLLEERQRTLELDGERRRKHAWNASSTGRASPVKGESLSNPRQGEVSEEHNRNRGDASARQGGYGFIDQLQRLRNGL